MAYWSRHDESDELTMEEAEKVESKDTWMAISLRERIKESTPGFDYQVKYTADGERLPEGGVMYMSPRM
eukprot:scaffold138900_cov52-Attheya_sp.AAC.3